jgi:membrane associated rhomboid family serine protease
VKVDAEMIIPIRTDYRMSRTPWVNYALLAANVVIYLLGYHAGSREGYHRIVDYMLHPDDPRLVQFFSSMFLHGGFAHLAGNMLFLWVFGNAINDRLGHFGYLAFYLGGGVLAGVGYILLSGVSPVVGASGAIAAVTGAYLVLLPRARVTVLALLLYVFMPFEIPSLYFVGFHVLWNLLQTSFNWGGKYAAGGGIAYAAHSAGYIYGIAIAAALLALRILPRDAFDLLNLIRTRHRRTRYRRMVTQGYDPFGYVNPKLQKTGRWVDTRTVEQVTPDSPGAKELLLRREISEAFSRNDLPAAAKRYLELIQLAEDPILSRPQQLDVANHLMAAEQHAAAADAYERFITHYPNYEHLPDIYLMLGLLYGRYLHQYDQAERYLTQAVDSLHDPRKLALGRSALEDAHRSRGT